MNEIFEIKDEVYDPTASPLKGIVAEKQQEKIIVHFLDGGVYAYTLNGKRSEESEIKTLATKPYSLISTGFTQEKQEELPKKGEVCWGSMADNLWRIGHFMCKDGDYFILSTQNDDRVDFSKHPKITTKNPYEEERVPHPGDEGYFWDSEPPMSAVFSKLRWTWNRNSQKFESSEGKSFQFFSLSKPKLIDYGKTNSAEPTE